MRNSLILVLLWSLAACGDPLANFERIEDVELADGQAAQALPDADDAAPTEGLLAKLLNRAPEQESTPEILDDDAIAIAADVADVGDDESSDDLVPDGTVDEVEAAVALQAPAILESEKATGLRGWLKRAAAADNAPAAVVAEPEISSAALVEPEKRSGLFGAFAPVKDLPETVQTASLGGDIAQVPNDTALAEPKKRSGLFGNLKREKVRTGPDARDVPYGTLLPFGEVARVCDAKRAGSKGQKLEKVPFHGRGYTLYDSAPGSAGARTFYVTGFSDNCPRQFTAALALFGSALVHEQLRYGRPSAEYPYSTTDQAYEKVKKSVCKVGKSKPCGAAMALIQKNTVFISTYEKFSDNARWADILLHDGAVVAAAIKKP